MPAIIERDPPQTMEGCPALGRANVYSVEQGIDAVLQVQLTDKNGAPFDLAAVQGFLGVSESLSEDANTGAVAAKFREAVLSEADGGAVVDSTTVSVYDVDAALIHVAVPALILRDAGVYVFALAVSDADGSTIHIEKGLLSVEASLFRPALSHGGDGPPTLLDLKMALRDTVDDNLRIGEVEFSPDEVVYALIRPIREWNEARPPLPLVDTKTFPYREQWMKASVAYLFLTAADWYRRVYAKAVGGGLSYDRYNKEKDYQAAGLQLLADWRTFVRKTKLSIAVQASFSSFC